MNDVSLHSNGFKQRDVRGIEPPDGRMILLGPERTVLVNSCPYFGLCRLVTRRQRPLGPTWLAEINDATVHAPTFAVTSGDTLWQLDDETQLPFESAGYSPSFEASGADRFRWADPSDLPVTRIDRAILLASRVSTSYFHWAFELLPKLLLIEQNAELRDVPILVDGRLGKAARDMLSLIVGSTRPIIPKMPDQKVSVDCLFVASSSSYLPDDRRLEPERAIVDPQMVQALAAKLRPTPNPRARTPLLWVSRRRYAMVNKEDGYLARDIENSGEVEALIAAAGGRTLAPEYLTLEEQRQEFSSADTVAMVAGSACVNLLFCRPGTRILILSQNQSVNPGLFLPIANALGLDLVWLFGHGVPSAAPRPHWNFLIDPLNLRRALSWLQTSLPDPDGMLPLV